MQIRHVILDRDGVLNEEAAHGGFITAPAQWRWISGALEALAMMRRAGIRVSVATNQSGVGRGLMSQTDLDAVHAHMVHEAALAGGSIDGVFACPHAPNVGCDCRKPAPGLIWAAITDSGLDAATTLVVGDDLRDLAAARAAGVAAALVLTGKGRATATQLPDPKVPVYDDLPALARCLVAERPGWGG
jgi:D-glycero-D-manno-heptose 1,7-bisphosphate phosphatase